MATIKYDNSKVETRKQASPGVHLFKIVSVRDRSEEGKQDIEVILEVAEGKDKGARVWSYPGLTEATAWKFRQFTDALGLPPKGSLNTAKLVGKPIGGLITEDTWDGEYRARLKTFLDPEKVGESLDEEEGEDLDDVTEDEGDEVDLDALDLDELKELIEEEELDLDADEIIGKSKGARAEAKLRAAIQEFYDAQEEEGDEDDDEDDDEDEDGEESYEDMDLSDLVTLAKERGIKLTVKERKDKQVIIDKLEEADEADEADDDDEEDEEPEPPARKGKASTKAKVAGKPAAKAVAADEDDDDEEEEQEDYSDWDEDDLREELESRGLSVKGTKKVMITRLERDDSKSGTKPF